MDFGKYAEVHGKLSPINSMKSRTMKCLGIGPTGNLQVSYKFLDLNTGKKLKKRSWKPKPMSYAIIKRVEYLEARERRSNRPGGWRFCNRNHEIFYDIPE